MTFELSERVFEVRIAEDIFHKLQHGAESSHEPMKEVIDRILRKELYAA